MIDQLLEYLTDPQWLRLVILGAFVLLLADGYLWPLLRRRKRNLGPPLERQQFDQAVIRMAWSRGGANFYFVLSLLGIGLTYSSYIGHPDVRVVLNVLIAVSIFSAFDKFRHALKIKRNLTA